MIAQQLVKIVGEGVKHLYGQQPGTASPGLEKTKKEIPGDFTIVVFPLVRFSRKSPETTAREIGEYLLETVPEIATFNVIKGFLNLVLKDGFWLEFLNQAGRQKNFGFLKPYPSVNYLCYSTLTVLKFKSQLIKIRVFC